MLLQAWTAMAFVRTKLAGWMIGWMFALAAGGCHAPWFARPETSRNHSRDTARTIVAPAAADPQPAADEQALAAVLDELHDLGELDPAAQQRLIAELRRTKPELWPLVTQQFRSSLAYHQELAGARKSTPVAELTEPLHSAAPAPSRHRLNEARSDSPAAGEEPPMVEIGVQVEPRPVRRGLPESGSQERAYPIVAVEDATEAAAGGVVQHQDSLAQAVLQASFEAARQSRPIEPRALHAVPAGEDASRQTLDPAAGDWRQHLERAAADLSRRVADSPQTTAEVHQHATLRMLRLLAGETEEALEPIPHISPVEQDYWSRQLFALATYLDHHQHPDEKRRAAASVTHLDEAVTKLRELGSLSLRNLTFCKQVYGFGAYEPYNTDRFSAGQQVSIYVEVENYRSRSTEAGYCTSLGATYEILNERGERVDGGAFPDVEDCCRSRRRDFHIQYGLVLPQRLASGQYRLQLVMKDRQSDKQGSASLAFEVGR